MAIASRPIARPPLADVVVAYLRRRRSLLVRLRRVEQALRRWDALEANALLPEGLRRPVRPPVLSHGVLDGGLVGRLAQAVANTLDYGRALTLDDLARTQQLHDTLGALVRLLQHGGLPPDRAVQQATTQLQALLDQP